MKALTSSCSNAIVERLGSSSPRVAVHVSDRPEFCFNLRSRNDKKGCNFWFLKLVQNKGISPVHAVPSKTQVDLETVESDFETVETQDQQSEQTNESKFVRLTFQLQKNCNFGEQFLLVGDDPMLGSWDPSDALPMTWSEGHIWTVELDMPAGKSILFKFILKGKAGDIIWQPGSDRIIHTWETMNRIIVCEDWENAELQKIIEEDQLAQSNEEPQVDSEMSTLAEKLDSPEEGLVSNVSKISGIEDSQTHVEEKPIAEPDLQQITGDSISSLVDKPMAIVAENIGSSEDLINSTSCKKKIKWCEESADSPEEGLVSYVSKISGIEDSQTHVEEKPIAESDLQQITGDSISSLVDKPMAIVAENIGSSEDLINSTSCKKKINWSEESADSPRNDDIIYVIGHNRIAAPLKNQERAVVEGNLFDFDGSPVLVPGLTQPAVPTEEPGPGEVQERTAIDTSIGAFESKDQNIPEFSKGQESDDSTPQEINATFNNKPELLDNENEEQSNVAPAMEDRSNSQPIDGNALQNDIQWGRETVKKFLTKLGLL